MPEAPTLMCGGENDPTVFFTNTQIMQAYWTGVLPAPTGAVTVLDIDPATPPSGPFALIQAGFQASQAALLEFYESTAGGGLSATEAQEQVVANTHQNEAPFCMLAARSFFQAL